MSPATAPVALLASGRCSWKQARNFKEVFKATTCLNIESRFGHTMVRPTMGMHMGLYLCCKETQRIAQSTLAMRRCSFGECGLIRPFVTWLISIPTTLPDVQLVSPVNTSAASCPLLRISLHDGLGHDVVILRTCCSDACIGHVRQVLTVGQRTWPNVVLWMDANPCLRHELADRCATLEETARATVYFLLDFASRTIVNLPQPCQRVVTCKTRKII